MKQTRALSQRKGFTLVEVVIAAAIFSVAMMAILTMEFTSLNAFATARDQTIASELSTRVLAVMRNEMTNWESTGANAVPNQPIYINDGTSPFGGASFISRIANTPWTWAAATPFRVNERLVATQTGNYCAYFRGGPMINALGAGEDAGGNTVNALYQVQVAVIYPSLANSFRTTDCATALNHCAATLNVLLAPPDPVSPTFDLENCGYRMVQNASLLRRDALAQ